MSAIFGIIRNDGGQADSGQLERMRDGLLQYGPADQGFWAEGTAGLGGCVAKLGPFEQADVPVLRDERLGLALAGDARIYNRDELTRDHGLDAGEGVSTQALLLQAYLKWGEDFPKYLNGDFAVAVWDAQKGRLLLARDHTGVRPLYYFRDHAVLAFATDYRALLALPFVSARLDEVKLYAFLSDTYHVDVESTFFADIRKLPQNRVMIISAKGASMRKYWLPGGGKKTRYPDEAAYASAMFDIVQDAIRRRVEYCAGLKKATELSGGQDSSVVTVLVGRELKKAGESPAAYSWSPPYGLLKMQPRDERWHIEAICQQEGISCRYCDYTQPLALDKLYTPMMADHPCGEVLFRELSHFQSTGVQAVFTGWGGDQGISHRANMFSLLLTGYWGCFLREARLAAKGSIVKFARTAIGNTVKPLFAPYSFFNDGKRGLPPIVNQAFAGRMRRRCRRDVLLFKMNPVKHFDSGDIPSRTEITAWAGAEHQIQYLFPFLDYRVIDFALSIPRHLFFKQGASRYLYRKAFSGILPKTLVWYPHKDDVAMHTYRSRDAHSQERAAFAASRMRRDLSSPYLDWDRIDGLLKSGFFTRSAEARSVLKKLEGCVILQKIQAQAGADRP